MRALRLLVLAAALSAPSAPVWAAGSVVDPASITAATTREQHRALAARYRAGAEEAKQAVEAYSALAKAYMESTGSSRLEQAAHCQQLMHEYQEVAAELDVLATTEEATAK